MAEVVKRLGAASIAVASTWETLYHTDGSMAVITNILVVNRNASSSRTIKIAHTVGGTTVNNADYVEFEETIEAKGSKKARGPFTLGIDDRIMIQASATDVNFIAYGSEVS